MPIVSFNEVKDSKLPISKLLGERVSRWVGYTNGRHRTRYLYFADAQEMPVCVTRIRRTS